MGIVLTATIACAGFAASGLLARSARRLDAVARVGSLGGNRRSGLPAWISSPLLRRLDAADVSVSPAAAVQTWLLGVLAAGLFGLALAPAVAVVATAIAFVGGPVSLHLARHRRDRRAAEAVPMMLEGAVAELRGGATVERAVDAAASGGGALAPDLRRVLARVGLGARFGDALASWPDERDIPGVRAAAGSLALAAEVGGPAADALDGLASSLRERLGAIADARALSAQARLSAVVVGAGPIGYLALSALADPAATGRLFSTRSGQVCLVVGLVFEALGALWMRSILGGRTS